MHSIGCHIPLYWTPAHDDNTWLYLKKHPNQIKSENRCYLKLNTFQRLVSKDIIALFILHVSRPAKPLPRPQTTYDGCWGGRLWNGLTFFSCFYQIYIFHLSGSFFVFPALFRFHPFPCSDFIPFFFFFSCINLSVGSDFSEFTWKRSDASRHLCDYLSLVHRHLLMLGVKSC